MKSYIKKLIYLEGFTSYDTLINSIRVVYILSFVLNNNIIAINKAIMIATVFLFEIPTGFFTDKYGDKKTFLISKFFSIVSLIFMIKIRNQLGFILSFILLGLSGAFESGARNSYYRRICKDYGVDYKDIKVNISQKSNIIKIIFSISSSILYAYNIFLPFVITLLMYVVSFFSLYFLPNDYVRMYTENESLINTTKNIFSEIFKDKEFFLKIFIYTVVNSLFILSFDYYQLFFKLYNIPIYLFGSIYAIFKIFSYYGVRLYKKKISYDLSNIFIFFSFLLISFKNVYLFLFAVIIQQVFFSFENTRFDIVLLDKLEKDNKGAHFESIISLIYSTLRIFILSFTAIILNYISIYNFFFACSLILVILFFMKNVKIAIMKKFNN